GVALVRPRGTIGDHGIEERDAEFLDVRARRRADVDPDLVDAYDGGVGAVLLREVSVEDRTHSEHAVLAAVGREYAHALRLERLVPERMRRHRAGAMQAHVALIGDLTYGVRREVERARDHAPRRAGADR